jgi:putative transposase
MGRPLRLIDPEWIYHVTCRGNNRGRVVYDRRDYECFVSELDKAATRYEWDVFSWCLLDNHHHVLLRTPKHGFSEGFREMNGNHSRRTNHRHGRSDHSFRNRPAVTPIAGDAHLIQSVLYIARNPIEAGLVRTAAAWQWGSYRALVGMEPAPPWLVVDEVLGLFGRTPEAARRELARIVHEGHVPVSDTGVGTTAA